MHGIGTKIRKQLERGRPAERPLPYDVGVKPQVSQAVSKNERVPSVWKIQEQTAVGMRPKLQ